MSAGNWDNGWAVGGPGEPPSLADHPGVAAKPLSVSAITDRISAVLEGQFRDIWVTGELTGWKVASSGHAYFALKDADAMLECIAWKSTLQRLRDRFRDGDLVEGWGSLSLYKKRGQYRLIVEAMKPVGAGVLWQKFLELKERLAAEGLFDPQRKRPLPRLPRRVGIVTSPTGAAIRDVLNVLRRRAPGLEVLIYPAKVQGDGAAADVERGLRALAASGRVEVILITRGGGSMEDLWAFNDERLARAIAASPVPVLSGVGHEVDFTICDFVADYRAPTPSAAAEILSADHLMVLARVRELAQRTERAAEQRLRDARRRTLHALESHALRLPERHLAEAQQRADDALRRLDDTVLGQLRDLRARYGEAAAALRGHDPALALQKGYAIVRRARDNKVLLSPDQAKPGELVIAKLREGDLRSVVVDDQADLFL